MEHKQFTQAAETMLFSPEFQDLRARLDFSEPNLWHILDISRRENLVSRFLAWLLNPREKHSFGDRFLKSLVVLALKTELGRSSDLVPVDVYVMDLSDVQVQREHRLGNRRCDIAVFSLEGEDPADGFLCIIENKISAGEGPDQTKDYYEASLVHFPEDAYPHRVYIYLSPDGDPPYDENFIPLSYQAVLQASTKLRGEPQTTETERFLLQQFTENIQRGIAMETKTLDLAQAIYDQHQELFEFILQNVNRDHSIGVTPTEKQEWDGRSRFFNIGEKAGSGYRWEDCRKHGFICAGGGKLYRNWMEQIQVDNVIYAYASGRGYVGIGTVEHQAVQFRVAKTSSGQSLAEVDLVGIYDGSEEDDTCDWIVFVKWDSSVAKHQAVRQVPITRATTSKIYDHRKEITEQVKLELVQEDA